MEAVPEGVVIAPLDGDHWLAVASRDSAGRLSPVRWVRVRVDPEGPISRVSFEPEPVSDGHQLWLPSGSVALVSAEDGGSGVAAVLVGAAHEESDKQLAIPFPARIEGATTVSLPERGEVTVRAVAQDGVGNVGPQAERQVIVDPEAPTGSIRWSGAVMETGSPGQVEERFVVGPGADLGVWVHDVGSGVVSWQLYVEGEGHSADEVYAQGGESIPVNGNVLNQEPSWADGEYTTRLVAKDRVGYEAQVAKQRVTVDTQPPKIEGRVLNDGFVADDGSVWYLPPVRLEVQAVDEGSGLASFAGRFQSREQSTGSVLGSGTTTTQKMTSQILTSGEVVETSAHQVQLSASDRVGNQSSFSLEILYDGEAPVIEATSPDGEVLPQGSSITILRGKSMRFYAQDAQSGLRMQRVAINRRLWQPGPRTITFEDAGYYEVWIEAEDRSGNVVDGFWKIRVNRREGGE
ncbi:MAG: hypothetical protein AAGD01_02180 [Acidobacteriota bacterium]